MPIYAKKLSKEWRAAFAEFESISGFEIMHQDEINDETMTPRQVWNANQDWFHALYCDVTNISTPFDLNETPKRKREES